MRAKNDNYPEVLTENEFNRFFTKVDKEGPIVKSELGKCWIWTASIRKEDGYGNFYLRGKRVYSHKLSYVIASGSFSEDLKLDHLCRNTSCVNPSHLEPVTDKINIFRGTGVAVTHSKKTHCPRKHLLEPPNLGKAAKKTGRRACLACARTHSKYHKAKSKGVNLDPKLFQQVSDEYYKEIIGVS